MHMGMPKGAASWRIVSNIAQIIYIGLEYSMFTLSNSSWDPKGPFDGCVRFPVGGAHLTMLLNELERFDQYLVVSSTLLPTGRSI